jgi:hypothetical protein
MENFIDDKSNKSTGNNKKNLYYDLCYYCSKEKFMISDPDAGFVCYNCKLIIDKYRNKLLEENKLRSN